MNGPHNRRGFEEYCKGMEKVYEEVSDNLLKLREFKHDLKNNYIYELALLKKGEYIKLEEHYKKNLDTVLFQCGSAENIYIAAIKETAKGKCKKVGGEFVSNFRVPLDVAFADFDVCTLILNILNNAVEAVAHMSQKKIKFDMKYHDSNLFLECTNACDYISDLYVEYGVCKRNSMDFLKTRKKEKGEHGLGFKIIMKIVDRYQGDMVIKISKGVFSVSIILYGAMV